MGSNSVFFDTNALLDYMGSAMERPRRPSVTKLMTECFEHDVTMYVSVGSLKDAYYILRRAGSSHDDLIKSMDHCLNSFEPVDLLVAHVEGALNSSEPDFEDGLIRAQAEMLQVDAIVTDDRKAFATCDIPHGSAAACLKALWPDAA